MCLMRILSNKLKIDCWDQFAFSSQTKETTTKLTALREVFLVTEVEKLAKHNLYLNCWQDSLLRASFLILLVRAANFIPQQASKGHGAVHPAAPCSP